MPLQLSGQKERLEPHKEFHGHPIFSMPFLVSGKDGYDNVVDVPREPASVAYVLERRMEAPKEVRKAWQKNSFFTGDGSAAGTLGDHLIVLDAQPLRELTSRSELYLGALVLSHEVWDELREQKDTLYLTAEEVKEARTPGYVKKGGVWTPVNKTVGKVWDFLSRGRDLTSYIQLVSESCPHYDNLLELNVNQTTKEGRPTMRSWVVRRIDYSSDANSNTNLDYRCGRLVGVAAGLAMKKVRGK